MQPNTPSIDQKPKSGTVKTVKVNIPVYPYLKVFLEALYGDKPELTLQDELGNILVAYLSKVKYTNCVYKEKVEERFTETFVVEMPARHVGRLGNFITPTNVFRLNRFLKTMFNNIFRTYVSAKSDYMEIKDAIRMFMEEYGLEDEYKFETLKKDFYRFRKRKKEKK